MVLFPNDFLISRQDKRKERVYLLTKDEENALAEVERLIADLADVEAVKAAVMKTLRFGAEPMDVVNAMSSGLQIVGTKYESGEYFLSELIMAGILSAEISKILKPYLESSMTEPFGKIVIATVKGDVHDIGKNIVAMMLSSAGFEVVDLGVDVPSEKIVETVREEKPDIVAMSCLLTIAMDEMKNVIDAIGRAGLRDMVKVLVGGRPVTREFAEEIGADAYASNAIEAIATSKLLIKDA